jgi:rhodanese-related sulfurtransferase
MLSDLSPEEVHALLVEHKALLIDVREPREFAVERIHGALNMPLSTFDAAFLPLDDPAKLIFQCGSGKRSATAADKASALLGGKTKHLAGGIGAWKQAGIATITLDPATGTVIDPGT